MSPYPEMVEIEGEMTEVGDLAGKGGYGIVVSTEFGPIRIDGMDDMDVDRLIPGISGRVRITIEPLDDEQVPEETQ